MPFSSHLSCIGCNIIIILFMQVDLAWELGHREGAKTASQYSKKMGIIAFVTGILIVLLIIGVNVGYVGYYYRVRQY